MTNLIPILLTMYIILAIISALGKDVIIDLVYGLSAGVLIIGMEIIPSVPWFNSL